MFNLNLTYTHLLNKLAKLTKRLAMTYKNRMAVYRMLEKMTAEPATLQINEAIIELQGLELKQDRKTRLWYVYDDIIEQMRNSEANFAKAISNYVPQQDSMIIAASEQDDITLGFSSVIENNKKTNQMKKAFISALTYPAFLILAILAVLFYFSVKIIPAMVATVTPNTHLSELSLFLISLTNSFKLWFAILLSILLVVILFIAWALPNLVTVHRKFLEDLPPFNMYRLMVGCGFLFALNSLGRAGFMHIDALEQMVKLAKPYLRHRIEIIMDLMADGMDIGQALIHSKLDFPDKQMVSELAIQIKYSDDDSLEVLSNTLAKDGLEAINKQAQGLKVLITLLVFGIIGFLYLAIYNLGFDLGNVQATINN